MSQLPHLRKNHCMADNDSTRLIYPDGTIGKCENMPSTDGVGDIYHDITDAEKLAWYKTVEQPPQCENCYLFPYCFDLITCPEAGRCSSNKLNWKTDRYTVLMKEKYLKQKQEGFSADIADSEKNECES